MGYIWDNVSIIFKKTFIDLINVFRNKIGGLDAMHLGGVFLWDRYDHFIDKDIVFLGA